MVSLIKFVVNHPLNSDNKFRALFQFAKWQINTLLNPHPIIYKFTENSNLIIIKGMTGATQNLYCGLHEYHDMGFLLHLLRPNDLFVDIGANIGSYTILASAEIGANTIAIEPIPKTFQHLKNNVLINNIHDKVELLNIGIGSDVGHIRFTKSHDTMNHVATNDETDTVDVQVNTVDNITKGKYPLLLKIDVEGFETEVIKGGENLLVQDKLKAVIIELNGSGNRYGYNDQQIHEKFLDMNFNPYVYNPLERKLIKNRSFGNHNTIYIRDIDFVKDRILKARKVIVRGKEI